MLQISDLSFAYEHRPLFKSLSVAIEQGQILHVQGSNGSGKSTFLLVVTGLLKPTSGSIKYHEGETTTTNLKPHAEYLAAEANGLYVKLSAIQNLEFYAGLRAPQITSDEIRAELDYWGLPDRIVISQLPVEKFSTGMKRRLALARLCLSNTTCWLLDEPFSGLDTQGVQCLFKALSRHLSQKRLCIMITHDDYLVRGGFEPKKIVISDFGK